MCGIFGAVGAKIEDYKNEDKMSAALDALSKRGPDDRGSLSFKKCVLGQTRLSIIDLTSGHQPMKDNRKDIAISFNGEIYNYRELKKELEGKGHEFSTNSDTEVILKTYIEYGEDCPKHLNGMFAFAIWDNEKEELFMARDRFGQKPLYYAFDESGNLVFASEIKALLRVDIKGEIDFNAIDGYLTTFYIPPFRSIYKNIKVLKPAHRAVFNLTNLKEERYWALERKPIEIGYEEAKIKVREMLQESVKKMMTADVEVGTMLSGGIDSTLVTYFAQSMSKKPIKTYAVGFENFINELPYAKEASDKFHTDHHELVMNVDIAKELREIAEYFDEPHADASTIPTHLIAKLAKEKVKVLLGGNGADEPFIGYGWYWKQWNLGMKARWIQKLTSTPFRDFLKSVTCFPKKEKKRLWKDVSHINKRHPMPFEPDKNMTELEKINLYDLNMFLPGNALGKVDRASMMASVEVRSPFLDHRLVEFAYNMPLAYKTNKRKGKLILKDILSEIMPEKFVYRKKQGFGPPIKAWMEKESMKKLVDELFVSNEAGIYEFMDKSYIKEVINDFYRNGKAPYRLWVLTCLELWHKNNKKYFK